MKTKSLILKGGLLTLLFIVSLSVYCFASAKEINPSSREITNQGRNDVSLSLTSVKGEALSEILQFWMGNGLYWETNYSDDAENIPASEQITQNKLDGKFRDKISEMPAVKNDSMNSLKIWMERGLYWNL